MKDQLTSTVDNIFRINLAVRKGEKVIVITDEFNEEITRAGRLIADRGRRFTPVIAYARYSPAGCHGTEPPGDVWEAAFGGNAYSGLKKAGLLAPLVSKTITGEQIKDAERIIGRYSKEAADAVIAVSYFSTSHTRFRYLLTRICGARYASMPLFDEMMLAGPMRVDWNEMMKMTQGVAEIVNKYDRIEMETPNGTFITLRRGGRKAVCDTGILTAPGSFGNLPAGEVYFAPLEGSAEGRLVLEWAPTRRLENPVTLHIAKGLVEEVQGSEPYAEYLRKKLSERDDNRNIAEFGIGTNNSASRPDNILESEKISGTVHIALGDNSSFGGRVSTPLHQDFVFFMPTVTLISGEDNKSETLLKHGRWSFSG